MAWDDFNTTELYDALRAFTAYPGITQQCLKAAANYLPACLEDLVLKQGCCSLACQGAILNVSSLPTLGRYQIDL